MTKRSRSGSRSLKKGLASSFKIRGARVQVNWQDAWSNNGWQAEERVKRAHGELNVHSVGFVQIHDEKGISIAYGKDENDNWLGQEFIPSAMIKSIEVI
jgi:hypothetical protein